MSEKPYGKFNLEQLKELSQFVNETRELAPTLENVFREANPQKLKEILGENFSWVHFYEMPLNEHVAWGALILDWKDDLAIAAKAEDPQQAFFDFLKRLDPDRDWDGGYKGYFQKADLVALVISIFRTIKCIMVYQKSLSTLIDEVRQGKDKALFDVVRIDRSAMACTPVKHRISIAEMKGDKKFFLHLKSALKGPSRKHWVSLEALRYMMHALVDTGADKLSNEQLESVFVEHLQLYSKQPSAQKNLRELYLKTKKGHHRK